MICPKCESAEMRPDPDRVHGMDAYYCWKCGKEMKRFAQDTFYWYYKCPKCGQENLVLKEKDNAGATPTEL
jgi:DNA-directed RNA polymerase subunit RPC12/RpoP